MSIHSFAFEEDFENIIEDLKVLGYNEEELINLAIQLLHFCMKKKLEGYSFGAWYEGEEGFIVAEECFITTPLDEKLATISYTGDLIFEEISEEEAEELMRHEDDEEDDEPWQLGDDWWTE